MEKKIKLLLSVIRLRDFFLQFFQSFIFILRVCFQPLIHIFFKITISQNYTIVIICIFLTQIKFDLFFFISRSFYFEIHSVPVV